MPTSSNTYNFQSIEVELLIREAFERIGILGEYVEGHKLDSARRSINFLLLDWMNRSVNLWTIKGAYLGLLPGQRQYVLEPNVSDIIQANIRSFFRQLNGTPQSNLGSSYDSMGGGIAVNAFDEDILTSCLQTGADSNISYDFGVDNEQTITFVGFISSLPNKPDREYELLIEATRGDPAVLADWYPLLSIDRATYKSGIPYFFDIPVPYENRAYRIRGINASAALDIAELYFTNNTIDTSMTNISHYEYNLYPNKYLQSRPSIYYLDRQPANPILNIWPTASQQYRCLFYSYMRMMQDAGLYTNSLDIPARLYPALVSGLAWQLALKFNPQLSEPMNAQYQLDFAMATTEDSENVSIYIDREDR